MIQVQILLTPTDFSVNFVFEKNENKQKRPPGLALFYKNNWQKKNIPKVKINLRAKNDLNKIFRFLLLVEMSGSVGFWFGRRRQDSGFRIRIGRGDLHDEVLQQSPD